ncbi:hypothetical protein AOPFMNJM_0085 [Methylobacterium jeotgali]|uniref:Uncharacterized protein n=1 Tax=Methylobacterium jeotgali TaxID=381630 RepID=A0ABQ4SSJ5_9HYPH|nr:hypothetical protein AwMethylo_27070 [Methylobacterium sp.]GJE04793.1 hypothetical protein AOPFMNJM_0085 [Methylobacterium jeotgali]
MPPISGLRRSVAGHYCAFCAHRLSLARTIDDGSDKAIGKANTETVLELVRQHLARPDAKITELRRSEGSAICGSVGFKNRDGL